MRLLRFYDWNLLEPVAGPHSFVRTLYAVAEVLQLERAGTRWNPRRNPRSFVRTLYTVAKVLLLEPAGTRGGTRTFLRTRYPKLKISGRTP